MIWTDWGYVMTPYVSEHTLTEVLCRYGLKRSSILPISGCENWVFQIAHNPSPYILRLTPSSHRTYTMVRAEIDWINCLHEQGLRVARAIPFGDREIVERVKVDDAYVSAVVFEKAQGSSPGYDNLEPSLIREWGEVVGKMHRLARVYHPRDDSCFRMHWDQDEKFNIEQYVPRSQSIVFEKFHSLVVRLRELPVDSASYGLIHADLNPDNFFVDEQGITVFDFDDCLYSWFLYDIAAIVFAVIENCPLVEDRRLFTHEFLSVFYRGYSTVNSVESRMWDAWPDLLKLQEFERYITLHRIPSLLQVHVYECERLRHNIENEIPYLDGQ